MDKGRPEEAPTEILPAAGQPVGSPPRWITVVAAAEPLSGMHSAPIPLDTSESTSDRL
jgi:hypothetical protein